ncbi:hypothetical protein [Maridesulfovibrio bastinii]|uniref:hypothetical protein n=1 Tax=Maridesulfovibrio bastinii TaxID=47157 RepID=UPI00041EFBD5|nr:hypothetical protein [Maridesulfovibrio bastinii]
MNKNDKTAETSEALKRMEKMDPFKFRSVSKHIEAMVESLNQQEKALAMENESDSDEASAS